MDLDALSSEAFAALRLAYNDIWTHPRKKFPIADTKVRDELEGAQVLTVKGGYCQLSADGLRACQEKFGTLIEQELVAQAQGDVVRVPFKGR